MQKAVGFLCALTPCDRSVDDIFKFATESKNSRFNSSRTCIGIDVQESLLLVEIKDVGGADVIAFQEDLFCGCDGGFDLGFQCRVINMSISTTSKLIIGIFIAVITTTIYSLPNLLRIRVRRRTNGGNKVN